MVSLTSMMPAVFLFFVAPLVAEFLLGNLPITMLGALVVLAPLYGGGALLVREVVRRSGRGWVSIIVLGVAFGVFEEAFTTQTLFNPNYLKLDLHLLEPAYVPALGIGVWWTLFVLTLHAVWSIGVSIALTEALVPERAREPWLGPRGLAVTCFLLASGGTATTFLTLKGDPFVGSIPQLTTSAALLAALVVLAFKLPRSASTRMDGPAPAPWRVGAFALIASSLFLLVPGRWQWWAVCAYLALYVAVISAVRRWSSLEGWDGRHRLGLAGGAALSYAGHAFPQPPVLGGDLRLDLIGNAVFASALVWLLAVAARRVSRSV